MDRVPQLTLRPSRKTQNEKRSFSFPLPDPTWDRDKQVTQGRSKASEPTPRHSGIIVILDDIRGRALASPDAFGTESAAL